MTEKTDANTVVTELPIEHLDAVTGGEANSEPKESISLNFTKVQWVYSHSGTS